MSDSPGSSEDENVARSEGESTNESDGETSFSETETPRATTAGTTDYTTSGTSDESRGTTASSTSGVGRKKNLIRTTRTTLTKLSQEPVKVSSTGGGDIIELEKTPLTTEIVANGLSELRRSLVNGKYAYSRLSAENKLLVDIEVLSSYVHLRYVNLKRNFLSDLKPLAALEYLEVLDASENCIESPENLPVTKHLKHLYLRRNKLTTISGVSPNSIVHLDLRENQLTSVDGLTDEIFPSLSVLELRGNSLTTLKGISLKNLQKLFAAENKISTIEGLTNCPKLQILHLRANRIFRLRDFPDLARLEYVNLRQNNIRRFTETTYLIHAPNIRTLIMMDNPISHSCRYRTEMTVSVPLLHRLDKSTIDATELEEGRRVFCGRMKGKIPPVMDDPAVLTPPDTREQLGDTVNADSSNNADKEGSDKSVKQEEEEEDERLVPPNTPTPPTMPKLITFDDLRYDCIGTDEVTDSDRAETANTEDGKGAPDSAPGTTEPLSSA